jgi:hypothetical protein
LKQHLALLLASTLVACSSSRAPEGTTGAEDLDDHAPRHRDAGQPDSGHDAGVPDAPATDARRDAPGTDSSDGTPTRLPCTTSFGNALVGGFGRLDGFVVSVVPPASGMCSADQHHVHLQVAAGGQTYDIAVNVDGGFIAQKDAPLPAGAWAEGWHPSVSLDYPADLGLHDTDFTPGSEAQIDQAVEGAVANANHVSVFATPFNPGGAHLVHRQGSGHDGAVILDPLSPLAHVLAFRFATQTF